MSLTINRQLTQGADTLNTIMGRHQTAMSKSLERVSTGLRINSAGDDSAGNAISEKMLTQIRALDQSHDNTQNANSLLRVADAAVTSIVDIVKTMRTKAVEAASDTLSDDERTTILRELNQLKEQVDASALVSHNGRYLLNGDYGTIDDASVYTTDADGNAVVYAADENGGIQRDKNKKPIVKDSLSFTDFSWKNSSENSMYFQTGPDRNDGILTHLMNMTAEYVFKGVYNSADGQSFDVSTTDKAAQLARNFDKAVSRALYQQAEIGVIQQRLDITAENLQMQSDETTAALSTIRDADMAKEMTNYVKNNVLMQATQAMMAQANTSLASFVDLVKQ